MSFSKKRIIRDGGLLIGVAVLVFVLLTFATPEKKKVTSSIDLSKKYTVNSDFLDGYYYGGSFFESGKDDYALLMNHRPHVEVFNVSLEGKNLKSFPVPNDTDEGIHYLTKRDGAYFAVVQVRGIHKYNEAGELVWVSKIGAHHDLGFDEHGNIYSFDIRPAKCDFPLGKVDCFLDHLVILSPEGEEQVRFPLSHLFEPYLPKEVSTKTVEMWRRKLQRHDPFHVNSLYVLPRDVPGFGDKGDYLISVRDLDMIAVVSKDVSKLKWVYQTPRLEHQHHVRLTPDNLLTVFDNGVRRKRSRVLLIDPIKKEIVWKFSLREREFYTQRHGSVELLPNGNFLVSLGRRALMFEITPQQQVAARFNLRTPDEPTLNPYRVGVIQR